MSPDFWTSAGGAVGALANALTALLAAAALAAVVLRPLGRVRRWALSASVRRPLRRPRSRTWAIEPDGGPRVAALLDADPAARPSRPLDVLSPAERHRRRRIIRAVAAVTRRVVDEEDVTPADLVSSLVAGARAGAVAPWPDAAGQLERLLRVAGTSRAVSLWARLLYPEESRRAAAYLLRASVHLRRFSEAEPVTRARLQLAGRSRAPRDFAAFASALSGAVVLVDSTGTRSGYADDTLVWHSRRYRGEASDTGDGHESYEQRHPDGSGCRLWTAHESRRAGDYDKRVMVLRGVSLAASASRGAVSFVLETSETCYAATEQGADPSEGSIGCKHVPPRSERNASDPQIVARPWEGRDGFRVVNARADDGRLTLVTAYVSLLTSDGHLVLARRSRKVRHGIGVMSATAGGVMEPDGDGASGDVDALGMPDPLECVLRETREELGLSLDPVAVRPVATFLTNVRGAGGSGQLVAVVLHLCRVAEDVAALRECRSAADPSLGGFELDDLVAVPVAPEAQPDGNTVTASQKLAAFAREHAAELDQHGLLSCLYGAAALDDVGKAAHAFRQAFPDHPWWLLPDSNGLTPRLVRDPRMLVSKMVCDVEGVVPRWRAAWDGLHEGLGGAEHALRRR